MANKYRGEVEFTDSEGKSYVLRLGVNQFLTIQGALEKLDGVAWQRTMLYAALRSSEAQKDMTLEDVGDLIDDLGLFKVDELLAQTRFGQMSAEALAQAKAKMEAATKLAESNGNPTKTETVSSA